jgi:hypothetical protein
VVRGILEQIGPLRWKGLLYDSGTGIEPNDPDEQQIINRKGHSVSRVPSLVRAVVRRPAASRFLLAVSFLQGLF